jgi:hypothetical protein
MLSLQHDAVVAAHGRLRDKKLVKREAVKATRGLVVSRFREFTKL